MQSDHALARTSRPDDVLAAAWRACAERGGPQLVVAADATGRFVVSWANTAAADLLGSVVEEIIHVPLDDLSRPVDTGPADWCEVVSALTAARGGERLVSVQRIDESRICAELEVRPVEPTWAGVPLPRHGVERAHGTWLVALTPQDPDSPAQELREAEHRFKALAEHAPVGIFLSEAGVRLGFVNEAFVALCGLQAARTLGTGWLDVVHPQDLPHLQEALFGVLDGAEQDLTIRILPLSNAQRWVQVRLAPVTTPRRGAGFIGTAEDITERRAREEQLTYQASHDSLTGLVNRRRLVETLHELLDSRRTRDREFAVLFCDLDGFKQVNDTLGHDAGDRVLIEVARRLSLTARDHDIVARVAGDEFVLVLRHIAGQEEAESAAIRHLHGLLQPLRVSGVPVQVSGSLGLALPEPGDTPESLMRAADRVMYEAKAGGPGHYRIAAPGRRGLEEGP
jgi:diguanylate cyclase (GGDEF)-like protein/PAS domain S-box-containing protein